jgi:heat shock protein HtpX
MGVVLVILGYIIGLTADPESGGAFGAIIALVLWLILLATAFSQGKEILILTTGARKIEKKDYPKLFNVVEEMTIASGLGKVPDIYIIDDDSPNAFAMGLKPHNSAVAVTSGLLRRLNRDELQGVIGHEIGHVINQDIRFMTIAAVTMGAIVMVSDVFLRSLRYGSRWRFSGRKSGQAQLIILLIAVLIAILAPIFAQLLYFACSRKREYLADASSARFTRFPDGLASALEKIIRGPKMYKDVNRAVAPMFIVNPLKGLSASRLFSTHPPVEKRIQILRAMGGRVNYSAYEAAYRSVEGPKKHLIGASSLVGDESLTVREPTIEAEPETEMIERSREVKHVVDNLAGYRKIPCFCGLNIKVPPGFTSDFISCPRCGVRHQVPL